MASQAIPLIVPGAGGNGNQIAANAATPVVQSVADRNREHAMVFRVICPVVHDYRVLGFLDKTSTTLTDGSDLQAPVTSHAATTGAGYAVTVFADRAWDGVALIVVNKSGGAAADVGVDRIVGV